MRSLRSGLAGLVAVLACLVLPLGLLSVWTAERVTDTSGYVAAVTPLASDPAVRQAATERLVAAATQAVDVGGLSDAEVALARQVLTRAVAQVVRSAAFRTVWVQANRVAHRQLLGALRQDTGQDVTLELAPLLESVLSPLRALGLPAGAISAAAGAATTITVADGPRVEQARTVYRVVDAAGSWLPLLGAALVALALLLAPRRSSVLRLLGAGSALTSAVLLAALVLARTPAVDSAPAQDRPVLAAIWDVLTQSLQRGVLAAIAVSVVVLAAGLAAGMVGGAVRRER